MSRPDQRSSLDLRSILGMSTILFCSIGLVLALVYWIAVGKVRGEIDAVLDREIAELRASYEQGGHDRLADELMVHLENASSDHDYYLLEAVASLFDKADQEAASEMAHDLKKLGELVTKDKKITDPPIVEGLEEFSKLVTKGNMAKWPDELETYNRDHTITISITEPENHTRERFLRAHAITLPTGGRVMVARDVTELVYARNRMRKALAVAGGLSLALAFSMGFLLNRNLLTRVRRMNQTVLQVLAGKPGERMPQSLQRDDFEELTFHFNEMLDEKDHLLAQIRGITDDIAHDLRTPLSRIRRHIESTLSLPMDEAERNEMLQKMLEETDFILETFNALLFIAQVESGTLRDSMETLALSDVVGGAVELYEPVAEEAGISFVLSLDSQARIMGSRHLLAQAIANLLDNAIKYSPGSGKIEVGTCSASSDILLRIRDFGFGIPEAERERVLQRFVRLDCARQFPGTGLGLSFVSAVAKLHGAELVLDDGHPGLEITIRFSKIA